MGELSSLENDGDDDCSICLVYLNFDDSSSRLFIRKTIKSEATFVLCEKCFQGQIRTSSYRKNPRRVEIKSAESGVTDSKLFAHTRVNYCRRKKKSLIS